ncbi:MAG TPA: type II secretion system protein [Vicinamibacterales bacterium]|nr:type II secretion system protein [Vicinamibacterales bacterium]
MDEQKATPARPLRTMTRSSGFTLMEMMIVMVLIVILAGIGLTVYGSSVQRAKEATLKEDLFRMRDAIDQYYADKNKYPGSLEDLVTEKYMRAVPQDPFTQSTDTWQTTMSDPDPSNPSQQSGISNVKSGSEQTGLDGSRYADW